MGTHVFEPNYCPHSLWMWANGGVVMVMGRGKGSLSVSVHPDSRKNTEPIQEGAVHLLFHIHSCLGE